ncbi:MAG: fumarylacetoacetate hydrolase family protein, partial [Bacteroidia bacterium]|nr:fumarylacetoacetate hydrolase family protein [Bacteroidia bacterium]
MKIICIGRNYSEHAKELKNEIPESPIFFMKPETALLKNNEDFYYPSFSKEIHYECELVIKINRNGKNILSEFAHKYYNEITVGIDFTARDIQNMCKAKSLPWEQAKAFDNSAPIGNFLILSDKQKQENINFRLDVNGITVQNGNTKDMIFSIAQIIAYVSKYITLKTGDLIFTGTPSGIGPVKIGDRLTAQIEGKVLLDFEI